MSTWAIDQAQEPLMLHMNESVQDEHTSFSSPSQIYNNQEEHGDCRFYKTQNDPQPTSVTSQVDDTQSRDIEINTQDIEVDYNDEEAKISRLKAVPRLDVVSSPKKILVVPTQLESKPQRIWASIAKDVQIPRNFGEPQSASRSHLSYTSPGSAVSEDCSTSVVIGGNDVRDCVNTAKIAVTSAQEPQGLNRSLMKSHQVSPSSESDKTITKKPPKSMRIERAPFPLAEYPSMPADRLLSDALDSDGNDHHTMRPQQQFISSQNTLELRHEASSPIQNDLNSDKHVRYCIEHESESTGFPEPVKSIQPGMKGTPASGQPHSDEQTDQSSQRTHSDVVEELGIIPSQQDAQIEKHYHHRDGMEQTEEVELPDHPTTTSCLVSQQGRKPISRAPSVRSTSPRAVLSDDEKLSSTSLFSMGLVALRREEQQKSRAIKAIQKQDIRLRRYKMNVEELQHRISELTKDNINYKHDSAQLKEWCIQHKARNDALYEKEQELEAALEDHRRENYNLAQVYGEAKKTIKQLVDKFRQDKAHHEREKGRQVEDSIKILNIKNQDLDKMTLELQQHKGTTSKLEQTISVLEKGLAQNFQDILSQHYKMMTTQFQKHGESMVERGQVNTAEHNQRRAQERRVLVSEIHKIMPAMNTNINELQNRLGGSIEQFDARLVDLSTTTDSLHKEQAKAWQYARDQFKTMAKIQDDSLQTSMSDLRKILSKYEESAQSETIRIIDLESTLAKTSQDLDDCQQGAANLARRLNEADQATKHVTEIECKLAGLNDHNSFLQQDLQKSKETVNNKSRSIDKTQKECNRLSEIAQSLQSRISALEEEIILSQAKTKETEEEFRTVRQAKVIIEAECQGLFSKVSTLEQNAAQANEAAKEEIQRLSKQMSDLAQERQTLREEILTLKTRKAASIVTFEAEKERLKTSLKVLNLELDSSCAKHADAVAKLENESEKQVMINQSISANMVALKAENKQIRIDTTQSTSDYGANEIELNNCKTTIQGLEGQLSLLVSDNETTLDQLSKSCQIGLTESKTTIDVLKEQVTQLESDKETTRSQLNKAVSEGRQLQINVTQLKSTQYDPATRRQHQTALQALRERSKEIEEKARRLDEVVQEASHKPARLQVAVARVEQQVLGHASKLLDFQIQNEAHLALKATMTAYLTQHGLLSNELTLDELVDRISSELSNQTAVVSGWRPQHAVVDDDKHSEGHDRYSSTQLASGILSTSRESRPLMAGPLRTLPQRAQKSSSPLKKQVRISEYGEPGRFYGPSSSDRGVFREIPDSQPQSITTTNYASLISAPEQALANPELGLLSRTRQSRGISAGRIENTFKEEVTEVKRSRITTREQSWSNMNCSMKSDDRYSSSSSQTNLDGVFPSGEGSQEFSNIDRGTWDAKLARTRDNKNGAESTPRGPLKSVLKQPHRRSSSRQEISQNNGLVGKKLSNNGSNRSDSKPAYQGYEASRRSGAPVKKTKSSDKGGQASNRPSAGADKKSTTLDERSPPMPQTKRKRALSEVADKSLGKRMKR